MCILLFSLVWILDCFLGSNHRPHVHTAWQLKRCHYLQHKYLQSANDMYIIKPCLMFLQREIC
jgi:hypothetical protein